MRLKFKLKSSSSSGKPVYPFYLFYTPPPPLAWPSHFSCGIVNTPRCQSPHETSACHSAPEFCSICQFRHLPQTEAQAEAEAAAEATAGQGASCPETYYDIRPLPVGFHLHLHLRLRLRCTCETPSIMRPFKGSNIIKLWTYNYAGNTLQLFNKAFDIVFYSSIKYELNWNIYT